MIFVASYKECQNWHGLPVSISISPPRSWRHGKEEAFAPSWELVSQWKRAVKNQKDIEEAWEEYTDNFLNLLDDRAKKVEQFLREQDPIRDVTLLCYEDSKAEAPKNYCHRNIVGELIQSRCPELWGGANVAPRNNLENLILEARKAKKPVTCIEVSEGFYELYCGGEELGLWSANGVKGQIADLIHPEWKPVSKRKVA